MQDKRKDKRFQARWKTAMAFSPAEKKPIFHTLTHDLSLNGTSIQSDTDEKANTVVTLLLIPPAINGVAQKVLKLKSVVMSSRPFRNGFRLGLSFIHDPELEKLRNILNGLDLSGDELPSEPDEAAPGKAAAPAAPAAPALSALELIKQRALNKKLSEEQLAASRVAQQKQLFKRMSDALMTAYRYFKELTEQLNQLKPEYAGTFVLLNVANFSGLVWKDDAWADCNPRPRSDDKEEKTFDRVTLVYTMANPAPLRIDRDPIAADKTEKALDETGITYRKEYTRNAQGNISTTSFFVSCEVKTRLVFSCDEANGRLRLETQNLERFGKMTYEFEIEALNQALLDELTLAMMGEPSSLGRLIRRVS